MGQKDMNAGGMEFSRRDFLKVSAAGAAAVGALNFAPAPAMAFTPDTGDTVTSYHTTCPYCSASCGQVVVAGASGKIYDIYGDVDSPINHGGLCAKGASAYQTVTNLRRLGAFSTNPANPVFAYNPDSAYANGIAYKRLGNLAWSPMPLDQAMTEIATGLVAARGGVTPGITADAACNSRHVQFFGCSHMNNEQNYTYRKLIAEFGTSLVEHQARI
ncbi:MAG TPA: twin-arginine translocation signal domain-containing protein [Coriobacteriia bacterium]